MNLPPDLIDLLQRAYSAERAAALAYQGHAGSVRNPDEKERIRRIEQDEWDHRDVVRQIMQQYAIPISSWHEIRFYWMGRVISLSCYVIGRFVPHYFAGRLESGNVCEYFRMMHLFHDIGITEHDDALYEMGIREKEHEAFFADCIRASPFLRLFEKAFHWGKNSLNDVDLANKRPVDQSEAYCRE